MTLNLEYQKRQTINALLEGRDIQGDRLFAHAFLTEVMAQAPTETWRFVLPIARRLLAFRNWSSQIYVAAFVDHCVARHDVALMLRTVPLSQGFDPEIEYMMGIVADLANIHGLKVPV
jgi:hypothetical protein